GAEITDEDCVAGCRNACDGEIGAGDAQRERLGPFVGEYPVGAHRCPAHVAPVAPQQEVPVAHLIEPRVGKQRERRPRQRPLERQLTAGVANVPLAGGSPDGQRREPEDDYVVATSPWHFLYFFPLPQGQGSLRPTLGSLRRTGLAWGSVPLPPPLPPPFEARAWGSAPPPDSIVLRARGAAVIGTEVGGLDGGGAPA